MTAARSFCRSPGRVPRDRWPTLLLVVIAAAAGCTREPPSTHGDILGDSLNGVSAFVQLLRAEGHPVTARSEITESACEDREAVIVFVDGDGDGPMAEEGAARLRHFLDRPGGQWLLLVGRDGDWSVDYWRFVAGRDDLTDAQRARARENGAASERALAAWYADLEPATSVVPFAAARLVVRGEVPGEAEHRVSMRLPWRRAEGGVHRGRWPWRRGVEPGADDMVEWEADGEPFLVRSIDGDQGDTILVMGSDMPLLNAGLVDRGNRRIAESLVGLLPDGSAVTVFGSADSGDGAEEDAGSLWKMVSVPPNPWIAAQMLLAILLFCWSRAPIFGRPNVRPTAAVRDFGHHVDAVGRLLEKTGDSVASGLLLAEWERTGRSGLAAGPSDAAAAGGTVVAGAGEAERHRATEGSQPEARTR